MEKEEEQYCVPELVRKAGLASHRGSVGGMTPKKSRLQYQDKLPRTNIGWDVHIQVGSYK